MHGYLIAVVSLSLATVACSDPAAPPDPSSTPVPSATALAAVRLFPATAGAPDSLIVQFNGAMMPGMERYLRLHHGRVDGTEVPLHCAWAADRTALQCRPQMPLMPGSTYVLHMGAGMRGRDGTHVDMSPGLAHGGAWVGRGMPGGVSGGGGMMGGAWNDGAGHEGMMIPFVR